MTTEQLVRKCFCKGCVPDREICHLSMCAKAKWQTLARAARRFVRLENERAMKRALKVCDEIDKETECRKTRRAGK
jgi:predicted transcriptional regulator of viral defense system